MLNDLRRIIGFYKSTHPHFLSVEYKFYRKWKHVIKLAISLNKKYVPCEIFRKEYKKQKDFVVIALKWNGKNVRRRTSGYVKQFINNKNIDCIYCGTKLTNDNATSDHIIPISKGGNNTQINLAICCTDCNSERGNTDFKSFIRYKNPKFYSIKDIFI